MMKRRSRAKYLIGTCPNTECHTTVGFPTSQVSVECPHCGQRNDRQAFDDIREYDRGGTSSNALKTLTTLLYGRVLTQTRAAKKAYDMQKVNGVSGYECKLLSPLLTDYGMDKSGCALPLAQLNQKDVFDCAALCDRTFVIEEEHLEKGGFGREVSGAEQYLRGILDAIKAANDEEDRLIPVHVDGDGHCLVHAISRCLVGRELFWHALRTNMRDHLVSNLDRYQASLQDFVSGIEWEEVVAEADAEYRPAYGEAHGLGNIHIFALANVLRRPIILLDGTEGMQSSGDYSATFLPCLYKPEECQGKKEGGELNSPIVIAWSSHGRNHFVPLVAVKSRAPALLPKSLLPDVWGGFDQEMLREYVTFDEQDRCAIGTGKALSESYIQKLIHAMQGLFYEMNEVSSSLVCDVQEQVLKNRGLTHLQIEDVIQITKLAVAEKRLNKCLDCTFLTEHSEVDEDMLLPGGELYEIAKDRFGHLEHKMELSFPYHGIAASYDKNKDRLHVLSQDMSCRWCPNDSLRLVTADGSTQYQNGDRTTTPTSAPSKCCGFKHFWEGKEYNNLPQVLPIRMEWQGETKEARVYWFEGESDPSLNSNAYQLASDAVNKHFPGEFGSERLVQQVVNMILKLTRKKGTHQQLEHQQFEPKKRSETEPGASDAAVSSPPPMMTTPTKIILIGEKHKTLHKEELTMSSKEREVKRRIEQNAPVMQSSKSGGQAKKPALQSDMKAMKVSKKEASPEAKGEATHKRSGSQEKRLRITSSDGRTVQMTFPSSVTFQQLDAAIRQQFDIPTGKIKIRYGFPPKELHVGDNPDDPLPLQHGEKVSVEIPEESQAKQRKTDSEEEKEPLVASGKRLDAPSRETRAVTKQLGKVLMMIVAEAIRAGEDVWSTVELMPELFEESGFFYEKVRSDLPLFKHGLHCTLAGMKEKTFAVNLKVRPRRLDLCLGKKHLKIGIGANQEESQCSEGEEEGMVGTLSGAVKRKEAGEGTEAFSGTGHSLRDPEEEARTRLKEEKTLLAHLLKLMDVEIHKLSEEIEEHKVREEELDERIERLEADQEDDSDNCASDSEHISRLRSERHDLQSELKLKRHKMKDLQTQRSQLVRDIGREESS